MRAGNGLRGGEGGNTHPKGGAGGGGASGDLGGASAWRGQSHDMLIRVEEGAEL